MIRATLIGGMLLSFLCLGPPAVEAQAPAVKFCDLVRSPERYAGKVVRTKAILVENHRPRVDGGDPFFYDPACRDKGSVVSADWGRFSPAESRVWREMENIRLKTDERGNSRVLVTAVGKFESGGRYGHLDWAGARFVVHAVERAHRVPPSVRLPKGDD